MSSEGQLGKNRGPQMGIVGDEAVIITGDGTILRPGRIALAEALQSARKNLEVKDVEEKDPSEEKTKPLMPKIH